MKKIDLENLEEVKEALKPLMEGLQFIINEIKKLPPEILQEMVKQIQTPKPLPKNNPFYYPDEDLEIKPEVKPSEHLVEKRD